MDVALAAWIILLWRTTTRVSILVVMDVALADLCVIEGIRHDSLNPCCNGCCSRRVHQQVHWIRIGGLNPCCNGCCSRRRDSAAIGQGSLSLNPCCNGCCSRRISTYVSTSNCSSVSILVVMDVALAEGCANTYYTDTDSVSILVVMDVALAVTKSLRKITQLKGLNPCCNGCCSRSLRFKPW